MSRGQGRMVFLGVLMGGLVGGLAVFLITRQRGERSRMFWLQLGRLFLTIIRHVMELGPRL